jgi:hypothetical protein
MVWAGKIDFRMKFYSKCWNILKKAYICTPNYRKQYSFLEPNTPTGYEYKLNYYRI